MTANQCKELRHALTLLRAVPRQFCGAATVELLKGVEASLLSIQDEQNKADDEALALELPPTDYEIDLMSEQQYKDLAESMTDEEIRQQVYGFTENK